MLQDAHIHLQDVKEYKYKNSILSGLPSEKVGRFFCNATSPDDWQIVRDLALNNDNVVPFFGVHPWFIEKIKPGWDTELTKFIQDPNSGIGEIGLDRLKKEIDFEKAKTVFDRQLEIAALFKKPVTIHCIDAWGEMVETLKRYDQKDLTFMAHAFNSSEEVVKELLKLNGYISFPLKYLEGRSQGLLEVFRIFPNERLLLETDFPYFSNSSAISEEYFRIISRLYKTAAEIKKINEEQFRKIIWENGTIFLHRTIAGKS